jgi:hypothetical protein
MMEITNVKRKCGPVNSVNLNPQMMENMVTDISKEIRAVTKETPVDHSHKAENAHIERAFPTRKLVTDKWTLGSTGSTT